jgi:hypothetical protein
MLTFICIITNLSTVALTTVKPTNITVTTNAATTAATTGTTGIQGNVSTTHPSTMSTSPKYIAPHFGGTLKRLVYVVSINIFYTSWRSYILAFCHARRETYAIKTCHQMHYTSMQYFVFFNSIIYLFIIFRR